MTDYVATTRILIPDLGTPPEFTDAQINALLLLNDDDVYLAAADAIDVLVADMAMNGATVKTDDLSISDKDSITTLMLRADRLRAQAIAAEGDDYTLVYTFAQRRYPEENVNPEAVPPWS